MDLSSIGKHIKEKRISKSWKRDELAEKTDLSVVYIGMIERGEKTPKLETFIRIINVLDISADEVLEDVLNDGYKVRMSRYVEKLDAMTQNQRNLFFQLIDTFE